MPSDPLAFPPGFLWGAATSAHQIEGSLDADGRGRCVWQAFTEREGTVEGGGDASRACDSYLRWERDVELVAGLGLNAYRFSISWPRVLPLGSGSVERRGLDHYERFVDALLARGITPVVTLNHWDMPEALMTEGGWAGRSSVAAFTEYADAVAARLGDRVTWWITQNEPWIIALLGYRLGLHAPGLRDLHASVAASHHLLLAHAAGADAIRARAPHARIGCALSLFPCDPATPSDRDRAAAWGSDGYVNRWFLDPLLRHGYPDDMREHFERALGRDLDGIVRSGDADLIAGRSDFLGVNYYTRRVMAHAEPDPENPFPWTVVSPQTQVPRTDEGWEVAPDSLRGLLLRLSGDYPQVPLMITENGGVFGDSPAHDGRVHDARRITFLLGHLRATAEAIAAGAGVVGYMHWSLMDNFEWALGYRPRFGLVYVDYPSGRLTVKDSGHLYGRIARANKI